MVLYSFPCRGQIVSLQAWQGVHGREAAQGDFTHLSLFLKGNMQTLACPLAPLTNPLCSSFRCAG